MVFHLVFFGRGAKVLLKHFIELDARLLAVAHLFGYVIAFVALFEQFGSVGHSIRQGY